MSCYFVVSIANNVASVTSSRASASYDTLPTGKWSQYIILCELVSRFGSFISHEKMTFRIKLAFILATAIAKIYDRTEGENISASHSPV